MDSGIHSVFTTVRAARFHDGSEIRAQDYLGTHFAEQDGKVGVCFRVWAPHANSVSVVGWFNGWDRMRGVMQRSAVDDSIWEVFFPGLRTYDCYKYSIETADGMLLEKADPFAFHAETRPKTASKLYDPSGYVWHDQAWLKCRSTQDTHQRPVNIYEMHLGSWKQRETGEVYSYRELAEIVIPYVKSMGYTHIELMPLMEYPNDATGGYQPTGWFAATSRYGTPHDLMYLVDRCHQAGVGIIFGWVCAALPSDCFGLAMFDGQPCFELPDAQMIQPWQSALFAFGKPEVQSFLLSSAIYWLEQFHADGLKVDSVAVMLYQNDGSKAQAADDYTKENPQAKRFLQTLTSQVYERFPGVLMIAEEATAWPVVTKPVEQGGLGFCYKWNQEWTRQVLTFTSAPELRRRKLARELDFTFMYAFEENFILPFSHEDVSDQGGQSLIERTLGSYDQKFAGLRTILGFQMAHPGKKLLFMGCEFGQFSAWAYDKVLDWKLLDYDIHRRMQRYTHDLNLFYLCSRELWENDCDWQSFQWVSTDYSEIGLFVFRRRAKDDSSILVVVNFSSYRYSNYRLGVEKVGLYEELFTSDRVEYGGHGVQNGQMLTEPIPAHGCEQSVELNVSPQTVLFLRAAARRKRGKNTR